MYGEHLRATPYSANEMHILRELSRKFPAQPAVQPVSQPRLFDKVKIKEDQREDQALATTPTDTQPDTQNETCEGSFNAKIGDTHGAEGVFVDALEDTLLDT